MPNYKDLAPRLGVAYDLFGNGKTALKATLSRYIVPNTVGVARQLNPFNTSVNTATRPWTDATTTGSRRSASSARCRTMRSVRSTSRRASIPIRLRVWQAPQ